MNRREFLETGLAGVATRLVATGFRDRAGGQSSVAAAGPVTVAFHFIGMHCRIIDKTGTNNRPYNLVSVKSGSHRPVMVLDKKNWVSGSLGKDESHDPDAFVWELKKEYTFPQAAEAGATTWEGTASERCPKTLDDWRWTSRLYKATVGGAIVKTNWRGEGVVGARYELNSEGEAGWVGELQCEPPLNADDRRAIWDINGTKQVVTDRFVYRVKTTSPVVTSKKDPNKAVTLTPIAQGEDIDIFIVTLMDGTGDPHGCKKGAKLAHSKLSHDLLDGATSKKPDPVLEECCPEEETQAVRDAVKKLDWLPNALFEKSGAKDARGVQKDRHYLSSLDTFCPGWDGS